MIDTLVFIELQGGGPTQKNTNAPLKFQIRIRIFSYFFVFFANRYKNRHKTRRRQYIFVTDLKLALYIVAKTSILGVKHHTTYIKVSK